MEKDHASYRCFRIYRSHAIAFFVVTCYFFVFGPAFRPFENAIITSSLSTPLEEPVLDFVEIGTSDFNTLIQQAQSSQKQNVHSLSVDAMKIYLDRLPSLPGSKKVNAGVVGYSPHPPTLDVYYIPLEDIEKHNLPDWLRGCNRVGKPHESAVQFLKEANQADLLKHQEVPIMSVAEIFTKFGGCRTKVFKLDVEGLDPELIMGYVGYLWQHPECHADEITFEFNELSSKVAQEKSIKALELVGYRRKTSIDFDSSYQYHKKEDARTWMVNARNTVDGDFFNSENMDSMLNGEGHF